MAIRIGTCISCGETKGINEFIVADGRRTKKCIDCGIDEIDIQDTVEVDKEEDATFQDAVDNMGEDFIPVDELD